MTPNNPATMSHPPTLPPAATTEEHEERERATYTHGHSPAVVADHARRSAQDSAAYLLPRLRPGMSILDVGCGPGSITVDLAGLVLGEEGLGGGEEGKGRVVGCDSVPSVLATARAHATSLALPNLTFVPADANALPFADNTFDIVHCHQLLQHVGDPVHVLREMRRVCKPGGLVAAREADYASFAWYPETKALSRWRELYQRAARRNGGEPNAGRLLHVWARQAGFAAADTDTENDTEEENEIEASWSVWRYGGERAQLFAGSWAGRILGEGFRGVVRREGWEEGEGEVERISEGWREWGEMEDRFIAIGHGEVLCRKGREADVL